MIAPENIRRQLYQLHQSYDALDGLYRETEGETTDVTEEVERFLADESDEVLETLCWSLRENEAMVAVAKKEAQRLAEVRKRAETRVARTEGHLLEVLRRRGGAKTIVGTFTIAIQKGRKRVDGDMPAEVLPDEFRRTKYEVDKVAIKAALEARREVDGFAFGTGPDKAVVK